MSHNCRPLTNQPSNSNRTEKISNIFNAVYYVDIPVMSAYLLLVGFAFVIINLIVDLTYLLIDPRLRDSQLKSEV